jgi:glyoxylase-like metal-dependent hydrolase (beta-lactamase superfamily II)
MRVLTVVTGPLAVNTYIVYRDGREDAVVIDPGDNPQSIARALNHAFLRPTHLLLTHGHFDHIGAVEELRKRYGAQVMIHIDDAEMLTSMTRHTMPFIHVTLSSKPADRQLGDGDVIEAAGVTFRVLHTPGHTPGSVCYIAEDMMFSGDTLFAGSIGRTDFDDGSSRDMGKSLRRLCTLDGDYTVLPGHGQATTLESERRHNPYMSFER